MTEPRITPNDYRAATTTAEEPPPLRPGPDQSLSALSSGVARGVDEVEVMREVIAMAGGPAVLDELDAPLTGLDRVARFGENLFGERQHAGSASGRVVAALVETVAEDVADAALSEATRRAVSGPVSTVVAALSAADERLGVEDGAKLFTALVAEGQPAAVAEGAASLLVDLGTVALSANVTNAGALGAVEEDLLAGEYGAVLQGAGMVGVAAGGTAESRAALTDRAAAEGERGVFAAWGNAAGDLWADVVLGEQRAPRVVPVEELTERGFFGGL